MAMVQQAPNKEDTWPWPTYSFQPFPNISLTRESTSIIGQIHSSHPIPDHHLLHDKSLNWQDVLLAVFVRLICLYIDTSDFVFAESKEDSPTTCFRVSVAPGLSWLELARLIQDEIRHPLSYSAARAALGIRENQNPFPVGIAWNAKVQDSDAASCLIVQVTPMVP
jgi:hypothetical protein